MKTQMEKPNRDLKSRKILRGIERKSNPRDAVLRFGKESKTKTEEEKTICGSKYNFVVAKINS